MKRWLLLLLVVGSVVCGAGCGKKEETGKEMTVVAEKKYEIEVKAAANYYMEKHPETYVKIEILPENEATRKNALQKKRTELMSGKGADVLILDCNLEIAENYKEPLLENVNKSVESGIFASLDYYMDQDESWKNNTYHPEILKAGQLKGRQYVLPLSCNYFVCVEPEGARMEGETLWDWLEEVENSENGALRSQIADGMNLTGARWQQPAVDYEEGKVLFDAEQWSDFMRELLPLCRGQFENEPEGAENELEGTENELAEAEAETEEPASYQISNVMIPPDLTREAAVSADCQIVPDLSGKKMAAVSAYGAVAMASDQKEDAYDFLMLFLNDEIREEKGESYAGIWQGGIDGAPVRESTWEDFLDLMYIKNETTRENMLGSFRELDGAYFPSEIEQKLYDDAGEILFPRRELSEEEIQELIDEAASRAKERYLMVVGE